MHEDKRQAERLPMFRVCTYRMQGCNYADLSTNISDRGIFIKNSNPPPVDTPVTISVKLPVSWGSSPLKIVGKVVHANTEPNPHKRGMGIEFTCVVAESGNIIEYFVREAYRQDGQRRAKLDELASSYPVRELSWQYNLAKRDGIKP